MTLAPIWRPWLGAVPEDGGVRFRVLSSAARAIELVLDARTIALDAGGDGVFSTFVAGAQAGDLYRYRLNGSEPMPDPSSRFQPAGVHGPSAIVDPRAYAWGDAGWRGIADRSLAREVVYELHVGTFSPAGTFAGVQERLPYLRDLGVTAIELMPIADFPGDRNWGYDGAALFAPARCYGQPDDLRTLVDAAHRIGLSVILDVVYNHFGPDGSYAIAFSPAILSTRHMNPWGAGINLDGPWSHMVRRMLIENALHWVHEYHIDGFRLDATHAMADDSPTHFVAELTAAVHASRPEAPPVVIAEEHGNLNYMIADEPRGWGLEGVWADDFHHIVHVMQTRETDGYYQDYAGTPGELARAIEQGWLFSGEPSAFFGRRRGTDPAGIPLDRFVICLQTHDQIGNRACGERLHHLTDPASWRAATVLLLLAPETPLLFMGQEWAASSPFVYFTDHHEQLGMLVTQGRRQEFSRFVAFADPATRDRIPDPQGAAAFESSRLKWDEIAREPHAGTLRLYRRVIALRQGHGTRDTGHGGGHRAQAQGVAAITLRRGDLLAAICLRDDASFALPEGRVVLDTEDQEFCGDPMPAIRDGETLRFRRPGAIVFESRIPNPQSRVPSPESPRRVPWPVSSVP